MEPFPFDPTYGFSPESLFAFQCDQATPPDFASFWRETYAECRATEMVSPTLVGEETMDSWKVRVIQFSTLGGFRIGAWLVIPENTGPITRGVVMGHGYGGRSEPDLAMAATDQEEPTALLFPCAPGFHLSRVDEEIPPNDSSQHVVCGIESREDYVLRVCVAALWTSASVLLREIPSIGKNLHLRGGSFGGGLGALALPWEDRFVTGELGEPTFGCHPFRLRHRCLGSGESVRQLWQRNPSIAETLPYYDAAIAARFIAKPTLYNLSLADPSVPPPGQFAVANATPASHRRILTHRFGHISWTYPEQVQERAELASARQQILQTSR